jgi:hypothetical protein
MVLKPPFVAKVTVNNVLNLVQIATSRREQEPQFKLMSNEFKAITYL